MSTRIQGAAAAPGLAAGRVSVWVPETAERAGATAAAPADPAAELARFATAAGHVQAELTALEAELTRRSDPHSAAIFGAQALIATDPELADQVSALLAQGVPLVRAVHEAGEQLAGVLEQIADEYLAQRAADVRDVCARIAADLTGANLVPPAPYEDTVLVTREIPPSAVARLDPARVRAIVTQGGGVTSHAALLAKGLGIPAVMGAEGILAAVTEGDPITVDGQAGIVTLRPEPAESAAFGQRLAAARAEAEELQAMRGLPAVTGSGRRVALAANLGSARGARGAVEAGAEGVGLFRTEFLFLDRPTLPSEEEQFAEYRAVLEAMAPHPVVIRTLDIGGDKPVAALDLPKEENPFLGWRGVRLWLDREDLAIPQIRALLRAARYGALSIMLPMIATVTELRRARALFDRVAADLGEQAGPYRLGIMIEIPAAALSAEAFAAECDFFSIGTNDLVQYTLAADRGNPRVAGLYDPLNPAVLRLIGFTVQAAHARGLTVAVCGDAAGNPAVLPTLVQLGVDELSMPPSLIPQARRQVRSLA